MPIRKAAGNTYPDVDWLWSPLVCGCEHQCAYCYAMINCKRRKIEWDLFPHWASENYKMILSDKVWKGFPKLPSGRIFVCDTTDLFANNVPPVWIEIILNHCWEQWCNNSNLSYVLQTKNLARLNEFNYIFERFPNGVLRFGITLETNRDTSAISKAPLPHQRAIDFAKFTKETQYESFVTVEPIMDFDLIQFIEMIEQIKPNLVWIGADSRNCRLPEPDQDKLISFFYDVREIVGDVRLKKNLNRLLPESWRLEDTSVEK